MTCVENFPAGGTVIPLTKQSFRAFENNYQLGWTLTLVLVAEIGSNKNLIPSDPKIKAIVHSYQATADQEIFIPGGLANAMLGGRVPYHKAAFQALVDRVTGRLNVLDSILAKRTFLVGERVTLADIFIVTALTNIFTSWFDAPARAKVPNLLRFVET